MKPRLLVACHDAGGAEVVSSWVKRHLDEWDVTYYLVEPAVEIFERKVDSNLHRKNWYAVSDYQKANLIICGSSKTSGVEHTSVQLARFYGVRSIVWLDHWKNYRQRFQWSHQTAIHLPNEVWVTDEHAEALALKELPGANVIVKGNPYLEDFAEDVKGIEKPRDHTGERFLFLCEPDWDKAIQRLGYVVPYSYLKWNWNWVVEPHAGIRFHPHPTQAIPWPYTLAESVAWADTVVGCDSMALVAALYAGRRVISLLPANEGSLPFPDIERPFSS